MSDHIRGATLWGAILLVAAVFPRAEAEERYTRQEVHSDWSVFCDEICWAATLTFDGAWMVMVTHYALGQTEMSVMRADGAPLRAQAVTLEVGCLSDRLALAEGVAFASTRARDPQIIAALRAGGDGLLRAAVRAAEGELRRFSTRGAQDAIDAIGYEPLPGAPAVTEPGCPVGS